MRALRRARRSASIAEVKRRQAGLVTPKTLAADIAARVKADGGITEAQSCLEDRIKRLKSIGMWQKASAVWLPHGYKEGKLYAAKGGAGADFGYTRGGTRKRKGATYVEEVPYNLLQYSEQFDNAVWTKGSTTVTANATASPDGKITADGVFETTANAFHEIYQSTTKAGINIQYTISAYVKGIGRNFVILRATDGAGNGVGKYFNISTGVAGGVYSTGTGFTLNDFSIVSDNNGFYKLKIVITSNAGTSILSAVTITTADGGPEVFVGDVTKGFYGWGIQTIYGSVEKDYFATTNRQNVPALDYTNSTCPSLSLEPARTNLLLQSEAFDNASWTKIEATPTANAVAGPENLSTADRLLETTVNATHRVEQVVTKAASALKYSFTAYVKGGLGRDWVLLQCASGANGAGNWFNITTGIKGAARVVGAGWTLDNASITPSANGFYRLEVNVTSGTETTIECPILISPDGSTLSYAGDVTKGFYAYGAQLEQASYATSYIKTEAATVSRVADAIPALLPKGTNQVLHSEAFDNAVWTKGESTVTANVVNAPNNTLTADRIRETIANTTHGVLQTITKPASELTYTLTVHVKPDGRDWVALLFSNTTTTSHGAWFNVTTGAIGQSREFGTGATLKAKKITPADNGFYRIEVTVTTDRSTSYRMDIYSCTADGVVTFAGDITKGLYVWGAQLEQGDEATTYVATTTAPVHNGTVIGQTEGTLYFDGSSFADLSGKDITISDGTTSNYIRFTFTYDAGPVYNVGATIVTGGVSQGGITRNFTTNTNYKIAVVYKSNYFAVFADGVKVGQDLTVVVPATAQIKFAHPDNTTPFYGNIRALVLSKTALTDAEAITLTQP